METLKYSLLDIQYIAATSIGVNTHDPKIENDPYLITSPSAPTPSNLIPPKI